MNRELPFDPLPIIAGNHQQTICGAFIQFQVSPRSKRVLIPLTDGDKISIEITTPRRWKPTDLTVLMLHGLCGSHRSSYLIRMTKKLKKKGVRSIRINMRGCGSGRGLARNPYHSGMSDDILEVLKWVKENTPNSPMILIGFSLGGNIVLKLSGELKEKALQYFHKVIAVSPPVDLLSSINLFRNPANQKYERYFLRLLKEDLVYRIKNFPDFPKIEMPDDVHFFEFDQILTAPYWGFKDPFEYYEKCSAKKVVPDIAVSCNILLSKDDPIVSYSSFENLILPSNIQIYMTQKGGHLGYLGYPKKFHWLDHVLLQWIDESLIQ